MRNIEKREEGRIDPALFLYPAVALCRCDGGFPYPAFAGNGCASAYRDDA